ncbi:MAG: hypothetical protein ACK53Y_01590 [bacterium]
MPRTGEGSIAFTRRCSLGCIAFEWLCNHHAYVIEVEGGGPTCPALYSSRIST